MQSSNLTSIIISTGYCDKVYHALSLAISLIEKNVNVQMFVSQAALLAFVSKQDNLFQTEWYNLPISPDITYTFQQKNPYDLEELYIQSGMQSWSSLIKISQTLKLNLFFCSYSVKILQIDITSEFKTTDHQIVPIHDFLTSNSNYIYI